MKPFCIISIVCLLVGIFSGLAHGTISGAEIIFCAVLVFENVMFLLTDDN